MKSDPADVHNGSGAKVTRVYREDLDEMLAQGASAFPRERYLAMFTEDAKIFWFAVNNAEGNAVQEEFASESAALAWLDGAEALNRYGEHVHCDGTKNVRGACDKRRMTWEEYISLNTTPAFRDIKNRD